MNENGIPRVISQTHPKSIIAEAFRTLRTNVNFSSAAGKPLHTLMVTSSGPEEGKSTTVANLSVVLAQAGYKVLIVDADLRKPVQNKIFQLDNHKGLTNLLVEDLEPSDLIRPTILEGLDILTTGPIPPNPSELLASQRMKELLDFFSEKYQIVLVDTPPAIAVTDAVVLATLVDGAILVIRGGMSRIEMVRDAKAVLDKTGVRIIGTVLNGVKMQGDNYYYYYYYYGEKRKSHRKHHQ